MEQKRSLLETFPEMAKVIAEYRRAFGQDQVSILYIKEGDNEVGIKPIQEKTNEKN